MYAIVDINGKQYQVEEGRYIDVDRLAHGEGETVQVGNVLMVVDGESSLLGAPYVEGASVTAKVLNDFRGPKLLVYKMRCKKGYRRKNGHRSEYTRLQIEDLVFPGKKASAKKAEPQEDSAEKKTAPKAKKADAAEAPKKKPAAKKADAGEKAEKAAPKKSTKKSEETPKED